MSVNNGRFGRDAESFWASITITTLNSRAVFLQIDGGYH